MFGDTANITTEGKRHLEAFIASENYKTACCNEIVQIWVSQLNILCEISETQPQTAYTVFTKGF